MFWFHVPRDKLGKGPHSPFVFISPLSLSLACIGLMAPKGLADSPAMIYLRPPRTFQYGGSSSIRQGTVSKTLLELGIGSYAKLRTLIPAAQRVHVFLG